MTGRPSGMSTATHSPDTAVAAATMAMVAPKSIASADVLMRVALVDQAPAQPTAITAAPGGIRFNDRVLSLGQTGSGKSTLLNYLFSTGYRCQRLLVDTKWEWTIEGVEPTTRVEALDWEQPIIHYRDERGDLDDFDRLFKACLQRVVHSGRQYGLVVCVHELADLCAHRPNSTPRYVNAYITKAMKKGGGLLAGSQRPVNMPKTARSESQHTFAFAPGFDADDRPVVAKNMRITDAQLEDLLTQAAALSPTGEHSYLWFEERAKRIHIRPPLPAALLRRSVVRSIE